MYQKELMNMYKTSIRWEHMVDCIKDIGLMLITNNVAPQAACSGHIHTFLRCGTNATKGLQFTF